MLAGTFRAAVGFNGIVERAENDICVGGRIEVVRRGGGSGFGGIGGFKERWLRRRRGKKRIGVGGGRGGEGMVRGGGGGGGGGEGGHGTPVISVGLGG